MTNLKSNRFNFYRLDAKSVQIHKNLNFCPNYVRFDNKSLQIHSKLKTNMFDKVFIVLTAIQSSKSGLYIFFDFFPIC